MWVFLVFEVKVNAFIIAIICSLLLVISLSYLVISSLVLEIHKLKSNKNDQIKEILELSTTNQLVNEIRKREANPIILTKITKEGVVVDCFNTPPALSLKALDKAGDLIRQNIKNKMDGMDLYE